MNKKYLAVFIFFILFPYIFKYNILEFFGDDFRSYSSAPNYNFINSYSNKLSDINNVLKTSVNKVVNNSNPVYYNNKKLNPFDKMNYKKAFIVNLNLQSLEDKYIYKLQQIL